MAIKLMEFSGASTGARRMDRVCTICGARYGDHYGAASFCKKKEYRNGENDTQFKESGYLAYKGGKFYGRYGETPSLQVIDPNMAFRIGKRK